MIPIKWVGLKPEQLREVLGAAATPTAALTFEAPINAHFDVLFDHAAAAAHGSDLAAADSLGVGLPLAKSNTRISAPHRCAGNLPLGAESL